MERRDDGFTWLSTSASIVRLSLSAYNHPWLRRNRKILLEILPDMYLAYSLLFTLGIVLSAPYHLWRQRKKMGLAHWRGRFGSLPIRQNSKGAIWVHAVSVGETLAVAGLVRELQRAFPERNIYLSHVTPTGREAGENRLPDVAGRLYLPLDWRWTARRVMRRLQPSLLIIVETDFGANLLRAARGAAGDAAHIVQAVGHGKRAEAIAGTA